MSAYCAKSGMPTSSVDFAVHGRYIMPDDTMEKLDLVEGDTIDVVKHGAQVAEGHGSTWIGQLSSVMRFALTVNPRKSAIIREVDSMLADLLVGSESKDFTIDEIEFYKVMLKHNETPPAN